MSEAFNLDPGRSALDAGRSALLDGRIGKRIENRSPPSPLPQPKLSRLERKVMEAFWSLGRVSIREVLETFPEPRPAYTTIQTIVYRLEVKEALRRVRKVSNAHIFEPLISPASPNGASSGTQQRLLEEILNFFEVSSQPVIAQLIESGKLTIEDARELKRKLEQRSSL
jgi:BlaI family penicillinase repressor